MGEIADMMLDGTLCSSCGEFIDSEDLGFPQQCFYCEKEEKASEKKAKEEKEKKKKET